MPDITDAQAIVFCNERLRPLAEYLRDLMASGAFVPVIDRTYPLEQIVEAADRSYLDLWSNREEWGSEPLGEVARYIEQGTGGYRTILDRLARNRNKVTMT